MIDLPNFSPLRLVQDAGKPGTKQFDALDQVLIVLPEKPAPGLFRQLPRGMHLKKLLERAVKSGASVASTHMDNARGTALTISTCKPSDSFQTLGWARQLIKTCLAQLRCPEPTAVRLAP